jgi:tetratricopeptide (TPR) repeat protein
MNRVNLSDTFGGRRFGAKQCRQLAMSLAICGITMQIPLPSAGVAQQQAPQRKSSSAALVDKAKELVRSGDPQGALNLLQQADPGGSDAADVHTMKGICLAVLARPVESAAEFDQAIALRPDYAPTYLSSGLAFASFDNLDLALARLSTALRLDPGLPGLRYNYALVLSRAGKYAESEENVDKELAGKSPRAQAPLELWRLKARDAYYQKKWPDTIDAYGRVLKLQPDWAEAYAAIGEGLFFLNRGQESITALTKAVALEPENGRVHELLGRLYQDAGKQDEAVAELEAADRLRPGDRETIYRLFRIYNGKGDEVNAARLDKELEDLLASNRAESDSEAKATVLNNAGVELEKKGDLTSALDHYDQAAKTDVTNIVFQRNAALLLCRMGRTQEAIRRLRDILSLDADDAETLQILAVANELAAGNPPTKEQALPQAQASQR